MGVASVATEEMEFVTDKALFSLEVIDQHELGTTFKSSYITAIECGYEFDELGPIYWSKSQIQVSVGYC